jgi:hypothetical protein
MEGRILCRNSLLKHVIEGKTEEGKEVTGRRGIKCKQLLHNPKGTRGSWKLKEEALDRTMWKIRFVRGYEPVVRLTTQ